jgi:hypothetical protein
MGTENPISPGAESRFRQAARRLGAEHGSAGLTPFVTDNRPEGDYSRTVTGYTSYLAYEDGVLLLMAALDVPVPEADEGPWFDACWRVAREYTDAYDSALAEGSQPRTATPAQMAARMRALGITDAHLREGDQLDEHPAGTLPDGRIAIVYEAGHPGTDGGPDIPMAQPLAVAVYVPGPDGGINEPEDSYGDLTPDQVIHVLAVYL